MIVQINELWDFFLLILEVMTLMCTLLLSNFHFKMQVDSVDIFQIMALMPIYIKAVYLVTVLKLQTKEICLLVDWISCKNDYGQKPIFWKRFLSNQFFWKNTKEFFENFRKFYWDKWYFKKPIFLIEVKGKHLLNTFSVVPFKQRIDGKF